MTYYSKLSTYFISISCLLFRTESIVCYMCIIKARLSILYQTHDVLSILFPYWSVMFCNHERSRYLFICLCPQHRYVLRQITRLDSRSRLDLSTRRRRTVVALRHILFYNNLYTVEYMIIISFSSPSTKQKVYMARFWLPLYSAVILSMYAYGILLTKSTSCMRLTTAGCCTVPCFTRPYLYLHLTCLSVHTAALY